jgi:hypothetical protein
MRNWLRASATGGRDARERLLERRIRLVVGRQDRRGTVPAGREPSLIGVGPAWLPSARRRLPLVFLIIPLALISPFVLKLLSSSRQVCEPGHHGPQCVLDYGSPTILGWLVLGMFVLAIIGVVAPWISAAWNGGGRL